MSSPSICTEAANLLRRFVHAAVGLAIVLLITAAAHGQTLFERLVMPGPLIEGHAKLEATCDKCHKPFSKETQTSLCLDCHKPVGADRIAKRGFHGKHPQALSQPCRHCHTDHKGRATDVVRLDRETFDHRLTDFALEGRHARAPCAGCHEPKTKFRDAPSGCIDCHRRDDRHKGRLGEACQSCHGPSGWKAVKPFDHDKTRFPLVAAHKKVACATCHADEVYKGLATTCIGCHRLNDSHQGQNGTRCETCHTPKRWKETKFDHARDTRFALRGKHAKAACASCHRANTYEIKPPRDCAECHGKSDPHKGSLGKRCETCHSEDGWQQRVAFDHDLTRFPLVGLHAAVTCEACHRTKRFKETPTRCAACHADTAHKARLGSDCARCHTPNGWRRWTFDHAKSARYPLTGAHAGLDCHACHTAPAAARVTAPRDCYGCHAQDDAHQGQFGRACERCHSTVRFRDVKLRR